VLLVNGRISERSLSRYRLFRPALAPLLERITLCLMQSQTDAERIRSLGAPAARVEVTGNLKWDLPEPERTSAAVRDGLGIPLSSAVLVAGSTFQGEEASLIEIWRSLRGEFPDLRMVLAPRHPHRFERVAALLSERGVPFSRRREGSGGPISPVLLLDTMGELREVYSAGTICFVGGSFVRRGGQNLMEPAAAGRPVLFGPRVENFQDAAAALVEAGGGFRVSDPGELLAVVRRLLREPAAGVEAGRRARAVVAAHRGATGRVAERVLQQLASGAV